MLEHKFFIVSKTKENDEKARKYLKYLINKYFVTDNTTDSFFVCSTLLFFSRERERIDKNIETRLKCFHCPNNQTPPLFPPLNITVSLFYAVKSVLSLKI